MKITRILAVILLCFMIISTFSACSDDSDAPDGFQLVACEGDRYRLYVPTQGWSANTDSGITSALASTEPYIAVNVFVADDADDMDLDAYFTYSEAKLKKELGEGNYALISTDNNYKLSGQAAKKFVYTAKTSLYSAEVVEYMVMTVLCRYKDEMYVFTYTAPAGEKYDVYYSDVEGEDSILSYFRFDVPYSGEGKVYPEDVETPDGMKIISTDEQPYRFFVPNAWKINTKTEFASASAPEDSSNVSLQFHMEPESEIYKTVDEYFAECEANYKNIFESYEKLSEETVTMDGKETKKYTYTVVSGGIEYKQMQAIVGKGGVFYVLTYTALPENYDSHLADVDRMIAEFEIRK